MTTKKQTTSKKTAKKATTKRVEKAEVKTATDATLTRADGVVIEGSAEAMRALAATKKPAAKKAKPAAIKELAQNLTELFTPEPAKKAKAKKTAKPAKATKPAKGETKGSILIALMSRKNGATGTELQKAAGWQAHSVRGFISAVVGKKLGLTVASEKNDAGERVYSIAAAKK